MGEIRAQNLHFSCRKLLTTRRRSRLLGLRAKAQAAFSSSIDELGISVSIPIKSASICLYVYLSICLSLYEYIHLCSELFAYICVYVFMFASI